MASMGKTQSNVDFPLDDLTYDLLTIVQEKSKALEAYEKYMRDAQSNSEIVRCLEQIRTDDIRHIQELKQHLSRCLQSQPQQGQTTVRRDGEQATRS